MSKRKAEREVREHARCVPTAGVLWIDVRWIEALGRERLAVICVEEGFDPPK